MLHFSKSKLLALRQCPKRLWLELHRSDLREDSDAADAGFETGNLVGGIARRIFDPAGQGVLIDVQNEGFNRAFARTLELLESPQPIFEAGFAAEGVMAFADVMLPAHTQGQQAWRMLEVKSSTAVKPHHLDDLAIQAFAALAAGVPLTRISLAHIDSSWTALLHKPCPPNC